MTNIEESIAYSPMGKTGIDDRTREIENRIIEQMREYHC